MSFRYSDIQYSVFRYYLRSQISDVSDVSDHRLDVHIREAGEVYTEVVYTSIHFYTLPLVGVYTSPGRWGAHYTTVHYPP